MDGSSTFHRLLQHEKSLSTAHRQVQLSLATGDGDDILLPQYVRGQEAICGGIEYHVDCLASTPTLPLKELIALPAEIRFETDRRHYRRVCGIVTAARAGQFDGSLAAYHLVVRDALAVMEKRTNTRVFRYQNELDIVRTVFDEWRERNSVLAAAFEYELDPLFDMRLFPPREQTMQHNESDAAFVQRLLKRRGISWYVRPGRSYNSPLDPAREPTPAHTLVLFSDAVTSLKESAAGNVRYHREDATDERDVVTSWTAVRSLQAGSVNRHSWDYKNPLGHQFMVASARSSVDQGTHGNQLAATLDDYQVEVPHAGEDIDDHTRLGRLRMARHDLDTKCFRGTGCVRDFRPGEYFELTGHPEVDTHPPHQRKFVITELVLEARNNLPTELAERADRLLAGRRRVDNDVASSILAPPADGKRSGLMQVDFTAVRRGVPLVPAFDPGTDLPHPELQSAIVVGPPSEEVHCDALGRVKIRFPGMREPDHKRAHGAGASDTPADSAWVRVASNWAGDGPGSQQQCGTLGVPRVGTEVLVTFLGGDPDKPVIIGQVFNQRAQPPDLSPLGGLPGNRHLSGVRSHEIGGQRGNQLRFDDTKGQISAQLASDHGASQLNLGWLAQPRANGWGEPRGEGAELRSDEAVAIRGGKGLLLSAEPAPNGAGTHLERSRLAGLIEVAGAMVDELNRLAVQHGDEDGHGLTDLVEKVKRWEDGANVSPEPRAAGAPILAMSAPGGIVVASDDNLALGASTNITAASVGDTELAAGRNIFLRALRSVSLFAHELGLKLVAARGDITLQTHRDKIQVISASDISLVSAKGISIQAPVVRVVSAGAQTEWRAGVIVHHSAEKHVVRAARVDHAGPGGGDPTVPDVVDTRLRTDERLVLRNAQTGEPMPNQRYTAYLAGGGTIDGTTDALGRTALGVGDIVGPIRFEIIPQELANKGPTNA